jgi:hypothetical protein
VSAADAPGEGRDRDGLGVRRRRALLAVAAAASAGVAATTTPFSRPANVVTALPIIALAVLVLVRWPLHAGPAEPEAGTAHPWRAWVVLFGLVVAWELAEYASRGSRAAHPTLSSMLDAVDRHAALKAVVFFLWLGVGAAIARAGRREHRRRREPRPGPS